MTAHPIGAYLSLARCAGTFVTRGFGMKTHDVCVVRRAYTSRILHPALCDGLFAR